MTDEEYLRDLSKYILEVKGDSELIRMFGQELINLGIRLKRNGKLEWVATNIWLGEDIILR